MLSRRRDVIVVGLAVVIALRCALGPYRELAGQPAALFFPPPPLRWLDAMPGAWAIGSVQLLGVVAAAAVVRSRKRVPLAVAWCALLFLAGLRTSLGKVLHNDVLLLLVTVPFLLCDEDDDRWPVAAALTVVAGAYFFAGYQKLVHTGPEWVTGDTMRWILRAGARSTKAMTPAVATFVAERAWLSTLSAACLLALELAFPVVLLWRRVRPAFAIAAVLLHTATFFVLGLDYWTAVAVVPLVLLDWRPVLARRRPPMLAA